MYFPQVAVTQCMRYEQGPESPRWVPESGHWQIIKMPAHLAQAKLELA